MDLFELQQENCKRLCTGISDYPEQDVIGAEHLQPLYGMQHLRVDRSAAIYDLVKDNLHPVR